MNSPSIAAVSPAQLNLDGPKEYQIEAVSAIRRKFDQKCLIDIARLDREQGRKALYHYINSYLDAVAQVPIDEVSRWIRSVEFDPTGRPPQRPSVEAPTRSSIDPILANFPLPPVKQSSHEFPNKRVRTEPPTIAYTGTNTAVLPQIACYHRLCFVKNCRTRTWRRAGNFLNHFRVHLAEYGNATAGWTCCDLTTLDETEFAEHQWKQHMKPYTLPTIPDDVQIPAARARASYPQHLPSDSNNQSAPNQKSRPVSEPVLSQPYESLVDEDPMSAHARTSTLAHVSTETPRASANSGNPGPIQQALAVTSSLPAAADNHPEYLPPQGTVTLHPSTAFQSTSGVGPDTGPASSFTSDWDVDMTAFLELNPDTDMSWN